MRDVFLPQAEFAREPRKGFRLFDRIEILALEVLDERELEDVLVGRLADDDRRIGDLAALRGAPAAFAGDDLEFVGPPPDDERLDDAVDFDRIDQLLQVLVAENGARLEGRGDDLVERHELHALAVFDGGRGRRDASMMSAPSPLPRATFAIGGQA